MNFVYYFHDVGSEGDVDKILSTILRKYRIISSEELLKYLQGKININNSCVLTIDDGWLSTYKYVLPVIKKYNVPITVFVSPKIVREESNFWYYLYEYCNQDNVKQLMIRDGVISENVKHFPLKSILKSLQIDIVYKYIREDIGEDRLKTIERGFVSIEELKEMNECPLVTIGAHTMTHPVLHNEDSKRSKDEIIDSVLELTRMLGKDINTFAYPNGIFGLDYSDREMEYCKDAGISMAFSTNPGYVKKGKTNTMGIPRIGNLNRLKLGKLGLKIHTISRENKVREEIKKYLFLKD